jgi:predicted tellurium resistance membrane protein TerC
MSWATEPQAWVALLTLTALELILGIDNIVLIAVLTGRLPQERQKVARRVGLALAMVLRIVLLLTMTWMMRLTSPLFSVFGNEISGRDLILMGGGIFLLAKGTHEIHHKLEESADGSVPKAVATFGAVLVQIAVLDIVFSLDSVITAVGMAEHVPVMVLAIIIAVLVMMALAEPISAFVERHPTVKILALSFLLLVGVALVADGLDHHIPRGYIYFALAFSTGVEALNLRAHARNRDQH